MKIKSTYHIIPDNLPPGPVDDWARKYTSQHKHDNKQNTQQQRTNKTKHIQH